MFQRGKMKQSAWSVWLPLGISACIFLGVTLIGNVLVIGSRLEALHPVIEWAFYGSVTLVFLWLVAIPVIRVLAAPVIALEDVTTGSFKFNYKTHTEVIWFGVFHFGRWISGYERACGQGRRAGSFGHERGFDFRQGGEGGCGQ